MNTYISMTFLTSENRKKTIRISKADPNVESSLISEVMDRFIQCGCIITNLGIVVQKISAKLTTTTITEIKLS